MPAQRNGKARAASRGGAKRAAAASRWVPRLRGAGRAKYLGLVESIRDGIARGELADAEQLPTQRALARRLGVNIATVTKAIAEAGRLGLVTTRPGGGTRVRSAGAALAPARAVGAAAVDLSINIPPVAVAKPMLDEAMASLAQRRQGEALFGYAPLGGSAGERDAASRWIALRGLRSAADRILVTQGAHEGLFAALSALTSPGDVVLCEALNYTGIRRLGELCRIRLVGVATDAGGLQPDALADACARHAPKAILTTPVTLNPTTATQDHARRAALVAIARRHAVTLIEDDIYGHLAGDAAPPLAALWPEGVIYVCGLSKCVAPGLRIGFLCAPERLRSRLRDALLQLSWTAPSFHAALASALIGAGLAQACADAHRAEALQRMRLAHEILAGHFVAGPAATYHGWLSLPAPWQERDAAAAFERHGVLVSPAQHFVVGEARAPAAVRLSLGAAADRAALERALRVVAGVLQMRSSAPGAIV